MTLSWLGVLNVVISPLVLGFAIVASFRLRTDRLFALAFALLAGSFALAASYFAWLVCGQSVEAFRYVPAPLGLVACLALRRRCIGSMHADAARSPLAARVTFAVAVILVLTSAADHALHGSATLALVGDEANIWAGKADAIFVEGGFHAGFAQRISSPVPLVHRDYPLLNPLLQLFTFANAGGLVHVGNRIPMFVCTLALLVLLASALRRSSGPWFAPALLLLVGGSDAIIEACTTAAADGLVALGLLAALECHARARNAVKFDPAGVKPWLSAFAVALAFLAWSKNEGMMLAVCVVVGVVASEWRSEVRLGARRIAVATLPCVVIVAAQVAFNAAFDLHNDLIGSVDAPSFIDRISANGSHNVAAIAASAWKHCILETYINNGIPALCVLLLIVLAKAAWRHARAYAVALALAFTGFFMIYAGTPHSIEWHLEWSIGRILLQLTPTCAVVIGTLCRASRAP